MKPSLPNQDTEYGNKPAPKGGLPQTGRKEAGSKEALFHTSTFLIRMHKSWSPASE
jgi:hypothetical protein